MRSLAAQTVVELGGRRSILHRQQQLCRLGINGGLVRQTAPTRTHPIVSRRPPGQTLSALPLSATDRLGHDLDRAARRLPQPVRPAFVSASNGVGAVARRIAQLPPLRRGECRETRLPPQECP